jgi:hypothetical protein
MENPGVNSLGNEQVPESSVEKSREQYIQEVMKGQNPKDRGYFQDKEGHFASPSNEDATLRVRDEHIEAARQEMNADFTQREENIGQSDVGEISDKAQMDSTTEPRTSTPLKGTAEISNVEESQKTNVQVPLERDLHQEALDRNAEANKIPSIEETLRAGQPRYNLKVQRSSGEMDDDWFATGISKDPDGVERVRVWRKSEDGGQPLKKDVKLKDLSQWNEKPPSGLSKKGQEFLRDSKEIQNDLQGKTFKESLTELMNKEDAQRYLGLLAKDLPEGQVEYTGPSQPADVEPSEISNIQKVFANIDQKLSQTQEGLSEIDSRIAEINNQLTEIQTSGNLTQEQLLEHMRLSQEFQGLVSQRFDTLLEQQRLNSEKNNALYKDLLNRIEGQREPEIPPTPETPPTAEVPTPGTSSAETDQLRQQVETQAQEIANLRGENTPEQRSAAIGRQLAELDTIKETRSLTDQEKIQYFDLLEAKKEIDTQLQNAEQESIRKRKRKHTIIKVGAFVAGAGVGALTPPVSAAALIAVGLGGPIIGRQGIKLSEKLRVKSNSLKYIDRRNKTATELAQIDAKIKRNEWWANRLGEVSSALMGAGAGYGAGKAVQSIINMFRTPSTPPATEGTPSGQQGELPQAPPATEVTPPQGSIELPPTQSGAATTSELSSGNWLRTGELGWDTSKWGWQDPDLFVPQGGVVEGAVPDLQGKFLSQLAELGITKDMLYGQQAGDIFNQGLRNAVYTSGSNLQEVANATAQALKNLNP